MRHKHELPVPPAAERDDRARELVRVWAAGGVQHVVLATGLWSDPAAWGLVLVDLARHAARSYASGDPDEEARVRDRIRQAFDAEWTHPTDSPS